MDRKTKKIQRKLDDTNLVIRIQEDLKKDAEKLIIEGRKRRKELERELKELS